MSWSYVLAAALLTTPPDVPEPPIDAEEWPAVQEALQSLAVEIRQLRIGADLVGIWVGFDLLLKLGQRNFRPFLLQLQ